MPKTIISQDYLHEAMDRTFIIQNNIEDFLTQSKTAEELPKVKKLFEQANDKLAEAYQLMGSKMK